MSVDALVQPVGGLGVELGRRRRRRRRMKHLLLLVGLGRELEVTLCLWVSRALTPRVRLRISLEVGLTLQLRSLSSRSSFGLPLGSVVEDVQASATGGNDISNEFSAFGADVAQRAAVGIQVGELLLH